MRTSRCSSSRARGPAIEKPASVEAAERTCTSAAGRRPEPAHVKFLGEAGADDEEAVIGEAGDREVPDDAAGGIEHRVPAPRRPGLRDAAGEHAVEPRARAAAGDLVLAVVGGLVEADGRRTAWHSARTTAKASERR